MPSNKAMNGLRKEFFRLSFRVLCAAIGVICIGPTTFAAQGPTGKPPLTQPGANAPQPANSAKCADDKAVAITPTQLEGDWTGDRGEVVHVARAAPNDSKNFLLKAQHEWKGSYDGSTLTFRRAPSVAEMSPVAPIWARLAVLGKIEWRVVLKPRLECGGMVLEGDWYPGELKFKEVDAPDGKVDSETASVVGLGPPIHFVFKKSTPSHLFLYAVTAHGLQSVDELYLGVATIVELQFDKPSSAKEWPVTIAVASNKLQLVAKQSDLLGYIFRTDAFVPRSGTIGKDQAFDPKLPPPRGAR